MFSVLHTQIQYILSYAEKLESVIKTGAKKGKYGPIVLMTVESQRWDKAQRTPRRFIMELENKQGQE